MACNTVLMLLFVVFVARVAGVERLGQYALARHYFELFLGISTTALAILISRRIAQDASCLSRCLSAAMVVAGLLALASVALLAGLCFVFQYSADTCTVVMTASIALLPAVVAAILEAVFVAIEKAQYVMVATVISSLLFVGCGVASIALGYDVAIIFAGLFLARSAMVLFYLVSLRRSAVSLEWAFDKTYLVGLVQEAKVFALENWCSTLSNHLDLILLSVFHNEFAVGVYAAASKVMKLGAMLANSYTRAIFPYLARLGKDAPDMLRRVTEASVKYMLALVLPFVMIVCLLADQVIDLLYTEMYADAALVLRILVWVVAVKFINPFLSHTLFARHQQQKSLRVAIIRLVAYSLLALLLIPSFGAVGAAWTSLGATLTAFGFYYASVFHSGDSGSGEGGHVLLGTIFRILLATMMAGSVLVIAGGRHVVAFVAVSTVAYVVLLFVLRVVSWQELKGFRRLRPHHQAD